MMMQDGLSERSREKVRRSEQGFVGPKAPSMLVDPGNPEYASELDAPVERFSGRKSSSRLLKGSTVPKPPNADGAGLCTILSHPLSVLLAFLPFGFASHLLGWGETMTFWFNFLGMVPLAKILGDATEELAAGLKNDMLAGLLNATFGNVVELVICVQSLRQGLYSVVKATLLGSVLSNMLLVLGMSFFFGGIVNFAKPRPLMALASTGGSLRAASKEGAAPPEQGGFASSLVMEKVQKFQSLGALVNVSMLLLSCLSFMIVTIFESVTHRERDDDYMERTLLPVSRTSALVVISSYAAYIVFQLCTHSRSLADEMEEDEEEEEPLISVNMAAAILFVTTILVSISSEMLVKAIKGVTEEANLSEHFIGIVLLPIIGNACEHAAAVRFAMKDKLGLSIGIAIGSSTQIALFAVPFAVLAGWAMHLPMDLNFGALNTSVLTISVIVVLSMVVDGQSNWLQGWLLMAAYVVIAICYWHLPNHMPHT